MTSDRRKQAEGLIYEYAFDSSATGRAIHTVASELLAAERELEQLREALLWLAKYGRIPLEPHDPVEWHGGMEENIASCPTCVVNAALAGREPA